MHLSQEMNDLWNKIYNIWNDRAMEDIPDSERITLVYYHQCLSRNSRYMFAYFQHRLGHIRSLRLEAGPVLPSYIRPLLSSRENDYFMEYNNILIDYSQSMGGLDLSSDLEVN